MLARESGATAALGEHMEGTCAPRSLGQTTLLKRPGVIGACTDPTCGRGLAARGRPYLSGFIVSVVLADRVGRAATVAV